MAYIAIARGSPWVVPSCEDKVSPLINKSMSDLYVFTRALDNRGHSFMTLFRATFRLRELKALVASTVKNASVVGSLKMDLAAWIAASHPLV